VGAGRPGSNSPQSFSRDMRSCRRRSTRRNGFTLGVTVAEAAPRILGGLPETGADKAGQALRARGVRTLVGARVTCVRACGLETSAGDSPADLIVWAAGVRAAEINSRLDLTTGRLNQFVLDDRLRASAPGAGQGPGRITGGRLSGPGRVATGRSRPLSLARQRLAHLPWPGPRAGLPHGRARQAGLPDRGASRPLGLYDPSCSTTASSWACAGPSCWL